MEVQDDHEIDTEIGLTLKSALAGDREALGRLLSGCTNQLYYAAFRVLGSREDAEDALQDGMLAAIRNLNSFQGRCQFSTWMRRIVLNAALMRLRKRQARQTLSIDREISDGEGISWATQVPDPRPNPEETYAREEQLAMLKQRLNILPAPYRSAMWLRNIEGSTIHEAAEVLGLSEATLKSRLHRVRLKLRKQEHDALRHQLPPLR